MNDQHTTDSVGTRAAPEGTTRQVAEGAGRPLTADLNGLLRFGAVLVTSLALAACSAIPPQAITDPLGLDGQGVEVDFAGALGAQAVPGEGGGTFTVADLDVNLVVSPGLMTNSVGFATNARLTGTDDGPATIMLSDPVLTVRLWHGANTYDEAADDARAEASISTTTEIVYQRGTCFVGATASCAYTYQSGSLTLGDIRLSGTPLRTVLGILTEEPTPNSGSVSLTVQGDPDELAGLTFIVELEASEGEIRF